MGVVYLDVDGVCNYYYKELLGPVGLLTPELRPKLQELIQAGHKIKWLTCHGTKDVPMNSGAFVCFCGVNQLQVMMGFDYDSPNFEYADWKENGQRLKTSAIDFSENFVWFEDGILEEEEQDLSDNDCLDRYFEVDEDRGLTWELVSRALIRLKEGEKDDSE